MFAFIREKSKYVVFRWKRFKPKDEEEALFFLDVF